MSDESEGITISEYNRESSSSGNFSEKSLYLFEDSYARCHMGSMSRTLLWTQVPAGACRQRRCRLRALR